VLFSENTINTTSSQLYTKERDSLEGGGIEEESVSVGGLQSPRQSVIRPHNSNNDGLSLETSKTCSATFSVYDSNVDSESSDDVESPGREL
jgi:hypothetical protein